MYIFAGNFDQEREMMGLLLNDFGILGNLLVIGGEVLEEIKAKKEDTRKLVIKRVKLDYDINGYKSLLLRIIDDKKRCKKIDLESKARLNDTLDFLESA